MDFLKKHYEKLILAVVLLLLAAGAVMMPILASSQRTAEEARIAELTRPKVKPLTLEDLTTNEMTLKRVQTTVDFDLAGSHNLFNPVRWVQKSDGTFIKVKTGNELGLGAMRVTAINPLLLTVSFDEVTGTNDTLKYTITVVRETFPVANQKSTRQVDPKADNSLLAIKKVDGPPNAPTSITLELKGDRDPIVISRAKPYTRVIGYSADLRYDPENLVRKGVRVRDQLILRGASGEVYNIIAIEQSEVIFSAKSNQKQTPIKLSAAIK